MSKPNIIIDKTVHLWWRRWYWSVGHQAFNGAACATGGWTLTRLGARFAARRRTRRGMR